MRGTTPNMWKTWACAKRKTCPSGATPWKRQTILITKDEDFADRARQSRNAPVIVWLRIGNVSHRALREWFVPQLPQILAWIEQGVRVLEIR